ncbi:hypothetical protein UPYG_G00110130 [Umbra pygmaea]|uniref:Myb/SANT-like DNA-binding domain-containing protein n=1 Tax=Umbra pygmaea TaxID=75934 RepID=A0ABD0X6V9_UMBPY
MLTARTRTRFTREQTRVLLREVHARRFSIYGKPSMPFRVTNARLAWQEVAEQVSSTPIGLRKTADQCRKRVNDLRRRQGIRIFENRLPQTVSTSSIKIEDAEHHIGDIDCEDETVGPSQTGTPQEVPKPDPACPFSFQSSTTSTPQTNQCLGQGQLLQAHVPLIKLQPVIQIQPAAQDFSALCQVHQAGYNMLHKEITTTRNSMEEMLHPLLLSINHNLERLASAVERLSAPGDV